MNRKWKMRMKSNFNKVQEMIENYLSLQSIQITITNSMHEVSLNSDGKDKQGNKMENYLYNGKNIAVLDMDAIAKEGYLRMKAPDSTEENSVNTADAFLINCKNEWYFIEFKDSVISNKTKSLKNNIVKKAYGNWYMLLDILYEMKEQGKANELFDYTNPIRFGKEHVHYVLVCSKEKNPQIVQQIRNQRMLKKRYTPPFMEKLKDYLFKDAYAFTEDYFEMDFVHQFTY